MIDDLRDLNRLIASHWLGRLESDEAAYVELASACIAQFAYSAAELTQLLARLREERWNHLTIGELNRRYLTFIRLAANDTSVDGLDMLARLGITLRQATFFRALCNEDLDRLAFGAAGPMMRFVAQTFQRGARLHVLAGQHHASALFAARQPANVLPPPQ